MQNCRWSVYPKKSDDIIDQLLANRDIKLSEKKVFLSPDYTNDLEDPFLIKDMSKAIKRIEKAIQGKEKIGIFADYDADGIPGAAILYKTFAMHDIEAQVYIPSREEGYGVNENGIKKLSQDGVSLLVTVDLGITAKKEVALANKLGMDVIITDHHEVQTRSFPDNAYAVLHTHLSEKYANKDLAGGAVAFKLAQAIGIKIGRPNIRDLKWLLDLPAICTICDMVPLTGENRVIAKYGLIVLSKTKNIGLKELYKVSKIDDKNMDTYTVGFLIGPRINAPGRMYRSISSSGSRLQNTLGDHAQASYYLLTTSNKHDASEIAKKLDEINTKRQQVLQEILVKARQMIKNDNLDREKIIIVRGQKWPGGIVGLVSSRITEEYCRPSIVFSEDKEILHGSARSIDAFHLVDNLKKVQTLLTSYGGHAKAAGVSLESKNFHKFYKLITQLARKEIRDIDLIKEIKIDAEVKAQDLSLKLVNELKKFEPFGLGNPRPVFMIKRIQVSDIKWVGREKNHLKLKLKHKNSLKILDAIYFGVDRTKLKIQKSDIVDIVFSISENVWQGVRRLDLKIIDLKTHLQNVLNDYNNG